MIIKTLATLRKENDMSQRDLAKKLELSPGAIGMYESGKRTPSLAIAKKIAKMFNVSVESISFSSNKKKIMKERSKDEKKHGQNSV